MALNRSNSNSIVSLIQGPPGSGKTAVIAGILAGLLHNNNFAGPSAASDAQPNNSNALGSSGSGSGKASAAAGSMTVEVAAPMGAQGLRLDRVPARRVLVCAQSNAAIDELITRLSATRPGDRCVACIFQQPVR